MTIHNVVLIDRLAVVFDAGLCALTGETGAGKSILLDSLGLALGGRSDAALVRKGADQAQVSAEFQLPAGHAVFAYLKDQGLDTQNPVILRRVIAADGRSRAFINDQPVSVAALKTVGDMLVEIHGQFETQSLLNPRIHRALLDAYGAGPDLPRRLEAAWDDWQEKQRELAQAQQNLGQARADETFLRQALEDLDALNPGQDEEEKLTSLRDRLMRREQILDSLNVAHQALGEAENKIGTAYRAVERAGDDAGNMLRALDGASAELQEVLTGIRNFSADLEESEYALPDIDDRLYALKDQARKHGCAVDALLAKREELARALNRIEHQDDALADLSVQVEKARAVYVAQAEKLCKQRRRAAQELDRKVTAELAPLKLDKARFETSVELLGEPDWSAAGMDRVVFLVAPNPGAAPGPLNKIASGGEMARFMLALKVVLAGADTAGTLVFDEVDSGIGGATAAAVGERLARLAQTRQVLVVTHSPQVAARAQHHWIVAKDGQKAVKTNIRPLSGRAQRREEIARMLSGAEITEEARAAAGKLLEAGTA